VEGRGGWDGLFEFGGRGAVFERYLKGRLVVVLGRGWERGKVRCRVAFWVVKWEWGGDFGGMWIGWGVDGMRVFETSLDGIVMVKVEKRRR